MSNYFEAGRAEDDPLSREGYQEADTIQAPPPPQHYAQQVPPGYGYGYGYGMRGGVPRLRRQYPIETKPFFLTSEFAAAVIAVIALAITAATSSTIDAWRFWLLTTGITSAYLLSRGIAKSGTRSNASDPREQMNLNWPRTGHDSEHQRH